MNKFSCRNPVCSCALDPSGLAGHWVTSLEQRCCCCDLALPLLCSSQKNLWKPRACWDQRCPCDWFVKFKKPKYATHKITFSPSPTFEYSLSVALSALFWCCQHPAASLQAAVQSCKMWVRTCCTQQLNLFLLCANSSGLKLLLRVQRNAVLVIPLGVTQIHFSSWCQTLRHLLQVFTSWKQISHPAKAKVCADGRLEILCHAEGCSRHCCRWGRRRNLGWEGGKVVKRV